MNAIYKLILLKLDFRINKYTSIFKGENPRMWSEKGLQEFDERAREEGRRLGSCIVLYLLKTDVLSAGGAKGEENWWPDGRGL